ncbi:MAG: DUF3800 domain-containing protein [Pseudomonadota bacterium]|nr:DUF3800 domain-containing protein [Pseudomonadota bacterium]
MPAWEAYFDESGDKDQGRVFTLAGYIFRSDRARILEGKWGKALSDAGVPFFHMVDCAHGNRAFKHLSKDSRSKLAKHCIDLIKQHASCGFCCAFNPNRFSHPMGLKKLEDPYTQAVNFTLLHVTARLNYNDSFPLLNVCFEAGHASQGSARKYIDETINLVGLLRSRIPPEIRFATKKEAVLLQCADLLAWQAATDIKNRADEIRPRRKDFISLLEAQHHFMYFMADNEFNLLTDREPIREGRLTDEYVKELFSTKTDSTQRLKEIQRMFDAQGLSEFGTDAIIGRKLPSQS